MFTNKHSHAVQCRLNGNIVCTQQTISFKYAINAFCQPAILLKVIALIEE